MKGRSKSISQSSVMFNVQLLTQYLTSEQFTGLPPSHAQGF